MKWYRPLAKKAAKPPAYLLERISDLKYACDVSKTAPREANQVLAEIISKLSEHHDDNFVPSLKEATKIMLDSPMRAADAIKKVIAVMIAEKEIKDDAEDEPSWKKKN